MNWSDLVKIISAKVSLAIATFVGTSVALFGHHYFPEYIHEVSETWRTLIVIADASSATLIVIAILGKLWRVLATCVPLAWQRLLSIRITENELKLLHTLSKDPSEGINLNDYAGGTNPSKMELMETARSLDKKGLISFNSFSRDLLTLTERGQDTLLKINRRKH